MITCICNNLRDKDVKKAADKGCTTPKSVQEYHLCKFKCSSCKDEIKCLLKRK